MGAEVIVLTVLGWFVAPAVTKLLNECFDSLGISAEKRQKKLEGAKQKVLPLLKSVQEEAEGSPHRKVVEGWLQRLKGAYHGVEKALALLRRKTARRNGKQQARPSFRVPKQLKWAIRVLKRCRDIILWPKKMRLRRRLRRRLDDLEKIAGEAEKLRTNYLSDTAAVLGRDEIIRRLKTEPAAGIPILPDALARKNVREESEGAGDRHFDLTMWVDACRNFDASEIMKDIIQQASTASEPHDDPVNPDNLAASLEELRLKVKKMLNAKKFLLVVDYAWRDGEDHRRNWDTLFRCLGECRSPGGSKIFVTSRANGDARRVEGEIARLTAAAEVKEREIAALERSARALKEAEDDLRNRNSLLADEIREKDDALTKLGETNSSQEAEIIKLKDALMASRERNAVLEGEIGKKKSTAAVLGAVSAGAAAAVAAAAAATAVYLRRAR